MNPIIYMAKKDLISFFRSKSTVFWTLAFPLIMMFLFSSMFGGGITYRIAYVNRDSGDLSQVLLKALNSTNITQLVEYSDLEEAKNAVREGEGAAVLLIPEGFTENLTRGGTSTLFLYVKDEPQLKVMVANFISGLVSKFNRRYRERMIEIASRYMPEEVGQGDTTFTREDIIRFLRGLGEPINVRAVLLSRPGVTSETAAYWENSGHWISVMLTYSLIFSGMVSASGLLADEKIKGTLKRMIASPSSRWSLLAGKILGGLIILSISQVMLIAITMLWLRPEVNWTPFLIPILITGDLASMSLGLLVTEISPDPKAASEAVVTVGVLVQFISGLYFPLDFLPGPLRAIAEIIPFTWAVKSLDGLLVLGRGLESVLPPVLYLAAAAVLFTTLAVILFPRWAKVE